MKTTKTKEKNNKLKNMKILRKNRSLSSVACPRLDFFYVFRIKVMKNINKSRKQYVDSGFMSGAIKVAL